MEYINCKAYSQEILDKIKNIPDGKKKKLMILTVGNDPASASYVKGKIKDCIYCGIPYEHVKLDGNYILDTSMMLETYIHQANNDPEIGGIIVQLPLGPGYDEKKFTDMVDPEKDVDGFVFNSKFKPCTPEGIVYIMKKELGSNLAGKEVLLIGKGKLVGKPLIDMLLDEGSTLTIAHSKTKDYGKLLWEFRDVVITAVGKPGLVHLDANHTPLVIDAGIALGEDGKLHGDCYGFDDSENSRPIRVTPVPGGIGLMTRAMLMAHMVKDIIEL